MNSIKKICRNITLIIFCFYTLQIHFTVLWNSLSHSYDITMSTSQNFEEITVLFQKQDKVTFTLSPDFTYWSSNRFFILVSQENYFLVTDTEKNITYTFSKKTLFLEKIQTQKEVFFIHYSSKGKILYVENPSKSQSLFFIYDRSGNLSYIKDTFWNISKLVNTWEEKKDKNDFFQTFKNENQTWALASVDEKQGVLYNKKTSPILYKRNDKTLYSIEDKKHVYTIDEKTNKRTKIFSWKNIQDIQVWKKGDIYILHTDGIKKVSWVSKKEVKVLSEKNIASFWVDEWREKIYFLKPNSLGYFSYNLKTKKIIQNDKEILYESLMYDKGSIHLYQLWKWKIIDEGIEFSEKYSQLLKNIQKTLKKKHFSQKQLQLLKNIITAKITLLQKSKEPTYIKIEKQFILKKLLILLESQSV